MRFFLHWGCLLIIALFAPIDLPAGGADRRKTEVIFSKEKEFSFAGNSCVLLCSPSFSSQTLCHINIGTPLRIVRFWENQNGEKWVQVQISTPNLIDMPLASRGWVNL